jgi:hypothetical protein
MKKSRTYKKWIKTLENRIKTEQNKRTKKVTKLVETYLKKPLDKMK